MTSPYSSTLFRREPLFAVLLFVLVSLGSNDTGLAQAVLSVTNFGARGDAVQVLVSTVSNSTTVAFPSTNPLSNSDVGKVILLFGVGPQTTPGHNQDLPGQIMAVTNGTNVTLSMPTGRTAGQVSCTYGTQNARAFQNCVDACADTNTLVTIPPGRYLLIPPSALDTNFNMQFWSESHPAVTISKGGIHFLGAGPDSSILMGNGAWTLRTNWCYRGEMFQCLGPVTNNSAWPLVFENLTMDGGLAQGRPATAGAGLTVDGSGWDVTHDAVVDIGTAPLHAVKNFVNCRFSNWRGEMIKSVVTDIDGFIGVTNCAFLNGSGSGFNFTFTHRISGCTFSNLDMAMEFYTGYMLGASVFENSTITNVRGGIVLVGALTNHVMPAYTISGNSIAPAQFGVLLGPARNVSITGNQFYGGATGISTDGAAYQGTDCNANINVVLNGFHDTYQAFLVGGAGADRMKNVVVSSNTAWGTWAFGSGYGWSTNVVFQGNLSLAGTNPNQQGGLNSSALKGQWFLDDPSNVFPPTSDMGGVGKTNIITYASGRLHNVSTAATNPVFALDDASPSQVPPGAQLMILHTGSHPATYYLSDTVPDPPGITLMSGDQIQCQWSNSRWNLTARFSTLLPPPQNVHVLTTN